MTFERDFQTYERELPRLLQQAREGHFALIHHNEIEEVFPGQDDAMDAGYTRHGAGRFLVKQILSADLDDPEQYTAACRD